MMHVNVGCDIVQWYGTRVGRVLISSTRAYVALPLVEELALEAVETVHPALLLRGGAPQLEAELARAELGLGNVVS